MHLRTYQVQAQ